FFGQGGWRHSITSRKGVVEAPETRKAAGESDLDDRQLGLCQKLFRQQQAARENQLDRRHAELFLYNAADLARAQREVPRDRFQRAFLVRRAFLDPLDDEVRDALGAVRGRAARRQLGAAPQARTKSRLLRLRRGAIKAAIDLFRRLRRANGAAINTGRGDAHEEEAVEAAIARD